MDKNAHSQDRLKCKSISILMIVIDVFHMKRQIYSCHCTSYSYIIHSCQLFSFVLRYVHKADVRGKHNREKVVKQDYSWASRSWYIRT